MERHFDSDQRRSSGERASNPAVIPILIALILIIGAVAVALLTKKPKEAIEASPLKEKPFAELPPNAPAPPREHKARPGLPDAPNSIATEPEWVRAQALSAEAKALYDEAVAAQRKGDLAFSSKKCDEAHYKFNLAVESSAEWEESLLSKYNDNDGKIRAIQATRTDWLNKLRQLEKGVSH